MSASIIDAYCTATSVVAAIDGLDGSSPAVRAKSCVSVLGAGAVEWLAEALGKPFRISEDRHGIEWPEDHGSIRLAQLLDPANSIIYFIRWKPDSARPQVLRQELFGCWKNPGGYALMEPEGEFRQKLIHKGIAEDIEGSWRWIYHGPQEFQTRRCSDSCGVPTEESIHTFRIVSYDGDTLILVDAITIAVGDYKGTVEMPVLWTRAKPPKSWAAGAH